MFLAGLVDLGFPLERLHHSLKALGLSVVSIRAERIRRESNRVIRLVQKGSGRPGTFATSRLPRQRQAGALIRWFQERPLQIQIKRELLRAFQLLAQSEAHVHRTPVSQTIFHQLAQPDTWVNLLGVAVGLRYFGVKNVYVSRVPIGSWHQDPHGRWQPIPGPATRYLLRRFPTIPRTDRFEWTTPTGAALLATFGSPDPPPPFRILRIGRGVGHGRPPHGPAALKLLLGRPIGRGAPLLHFSSSVWRRGGVRRAGA